MTYSPNDERNLIFGQAVLRLRGITGLTQVQLGQYLGISRRGVGDWEVGNTYPKSHHLKQLIVLALENGFFETGREVAAIRELWRAARQKV